jgi:Xaa-Pro aminopeptidase
MSDVDRRRAQRLMSERGLDAVVLGKPENFAWATGCAPGVAAFWRRAGAALALVPADAGAPIAAVATELFAPGLRCALGDAQVRSHADWIETADIRAWVDSDEPAAVLAERAWTAAGRPADGLARPAAFDARAAFAALGDLLARQGLAGARVGLDLDFWPVLDFRLLEQTLPGVRWVDASATIGAVRAVKSAAEIARLRQAAAIAEAGMHAALAAVRAGVSRHEIADAWAGGVAASARAQGVRLSGQWEYVSVGPLPWGGNAAVAGGSVIKFDVGCLVDGCSSDCGRTYAWGRAAPRARGIMAALHEAFEAGLEVLKPGHLLSEVHARATAAMQRAGFARFSRGHFGHSLGRDTFCEVPPFVAAQAHVPIEPGMVLAFETPFYVDGEGGFIIEDQFVITDTGAEAAWSLPRHLVELG